MDRSGLRFPFYIALVLLLAAVEATLPGLLHLDVGRPLLLVPLVFFFALRSGTLEGMALSLFAGFVHDFAGGAPAGQGATAAVVLFVIARLMLAALRAEGPLTAAAFCFVLGVCWHLVRAGLVRAFGPAAVPLSETSWLATGLWAGWATALASPLVLWVARRIGPRDEDARGTPGLRGTGTR